MAFVKTATMAKGVWSTSEHERFLEAIALFPNGPWTRITAHVGTRSAKQVQTHAQKYQHKLLRHQRGLLKRKTKSSRVEHRVDKTTADQLTSGFIVRPASRSLSSPAPDSPSSVSQTTVKIEPRRTFKHSGSFRASLEASECPRTLWLPEPQPLPQAHVVCSPAWSMASTQSSTCSSPRGLEMLLSHVEPMPFRPEFRSRSAAESSAWWDSLDLLLACDSFTLDSESIIV